MAKSFGLTLGALFVVFGGGCQRGEVAATTATASRDDERAATLRKSHSSVEHWERLSAMAERMAEAGYEGVRPDMPSGLLVGFSHAKRRNMEWRLKGIGDEGANQIPVSFLIARADAPFDGDLASEAKVEIHAMADGDLATVASQAITEAESQFPAVRAKPSDGISWSCRSALLAAGDYRVQAKITEWPPDNTDPLSRSQVMVFLLYVLPGTTVDFSQVNAGGFDL